MKSQLNIMTLGGLALAVGILVDDATVAIENINWNLEQGKEVEQAILENAEQVCAVPALVSTLCICIVFVPMFFYRRLPMLFVPMAEAVIFAMLASYLLSRTLVATLAKYLLYTHQESQRRIAQKASVLDRVHAKFNEGFEAMRGHYLQLLQSVLENDKVFIIGFLGFIFLSLLLLAPF